jgi:hypothetical protein
MKVPKFGQNKNKDEKKKYYEQLEINDSKKKQPKKLLLGKLTV